MARKPVAAKSAPASNIPEFSKDQELEAYRDMLLIRRFEEKAGQMYGMGLIGGFCHLYIGQEAVVTGVTMASRKGADAQITGYRDHGHMLAMGIDPKGVMAELTGRAARPQSKGKGGSMHMFSNEHRFYGGNGIVGAQVSLGTGLAFAAKYRGDDTVSLTYFGDGAANQGQVYESFNMAKLWKLPVVYIIENNRYGMGTSVERASGQTNLSPARRELRYSRRAGRRHGHPHDARRRPPRHRPCARGQGALHPRDDDLSLSRPLDVGPGEVPQQGRGGDDARRARSDRAGQEPHSRKALRHRGKPEGDRDRSARRSSPRPPTSPPAMPSRDAAELWTDIYADA